LEEFKTTTVAIAPKKRDNVFIHPTAEISEVAAIGSGTIIWNHTQVRENAVIGCNCTLGKNIYVDLGVKIGDKVKIQNSALLYRGLTIESGVFIGPGVVFLNDKMPRAINADNTLKTITDWEVGHITVSYGASIGAGAIVLPMVTVGTFALVGAGSVVTRDVPPHSLVIGSPARLVAYVCKCATKLTRDKGNSYICLTCGDHYHFQ